MEPLAHLRDSVPWPVLPVTPALPARRLLDLEPFAQPEDLEGARQEGAQEVGSEQQDQVLLGDPPPPSGLSAVIRREVVTIAPDRTVAELEALLRGHRISGVPVTDPTTQELLGVVSQVDIARHFGQSESGSDSSSGYHHSLWHQPLTCLPDEEQALVRDIMTPFVYFATEDVGLLELLDLMLDNHIHRVVITRERRLVGVVTSTDLLEYMRGQLRAASLLEGVQALSPSGPAQAPAANVDRG